MTKQSENPPVMPADGANGVASVPEGGSPGQHRTKMDGRPDTRELPQEIERLLQAAPAQNIALVVLVGHLFEIEAWRSRNGCSIDPDLAERSAWVADIARLLVALVPAQDRVDLKIKALALLQAEPACQRHGHLRALLEFALRLDLVRLDLAADDEFARNLRASLDKSPAVKPPGI